MSFAVRRGAPTAAQLHLDERLSAAAAASGAGSARAGDVSDLQLPALLYWSMATSPRNIHMINGLTGESFTNEQILRRAVTLARALIARGATGKVMMCVMSNHEHLVALYYGAFFAGTAPFLLDPRSTTQEILHFLPLVEPCAVICETERLGDVTDAVQQYGQISLDDVTTPDAFAQLAASQHDSDPALFQPVEMERTALAVVLPTSGSTGLPKAVKLTHRALLAHLPCLWCYHEQFPTPTERVMFMSTAQWMTFTNLLTTCPVYQITAILTPDKSTPTVLRIIEHFKPTWLLLVPGAAVALSAAATAAPEGTLSSLRTVVITGAACPPRTIPELQALAPQAEILNLYGMTEAHGFVSIAHKETPVSHRCIGKILNIFEYKLVDDDGNEVKRGERGELYLSSDCMIKGYIKNEEAYRECVTEDGWWRTGDVFTEDRDRNMLFVERKKFWFKYLNYQISPEELEGVISGVEGVQEVAVTDSERGAAAAVVLRPDSGARADRIRGDIHDAVNKAFIEYKRLRGGIAFVESLPRTHSGKLHRAECTELVKKLSDQGLCN